MRVTVRVFAMLREAAGRSEWPCDVPAEATPVDVWDVAVHTHPGLARFTGATSCAVNEEFATMTTRLAEGDEVAFLPPVSGGAG